MSLSYDRDFSINHERNITNVTQLKHTKGTIGSFIVLIGNERNSSESLVYVRMTEIKSVVIGFSLRQIKSN